MNPRNNSRLLVALLALALFAGGLAQSYLSVDRVRIFTSSGVSFLNDVDKVSHGKAVSFSRRDASPLAAWICGKMAAAFEIEPLHAANALYAGAWGLLIALVLLVLSLYVAWPFALFGAAALMLHPQWLQRLYETAPYASATVDLIVPTLLALLALHARKWLRFSLLGAAGLWAGTAIFAHHLGLFCAVGLPAGLALAGERRERRPGTIALAPHGWELLVVTLALAVGFVAVYKITGVKGKALVDFIFGPLATDHPRFAMDGVVYLQGTTGEPPLWVAAWLWLVRTPPMLLLGALMALVALKHRAIPARFAALWLLSANALVLALAATLSGSTLYFPGLDLMPALSVYTVMLAAYGFAGFYRHVRGRLLDGRQVEIALLAIPGLLALGHQVHVGASHGPYTASYANVLGSSTESHLARGNTLFAQPAIDSWAVEAMADVGTKVAVVPWGRDARAVLKAAGLPAGLKKPLQARDGGSLPTLVLYAPESPYYQLVSRYCNEEHKLASLNAGATPLWCVAQFR